MFPSPWRLLTVLLIAAIGLFNSAGSSKRPKATVRFYAEVPKENGSTFGLKLPRADGNGELWISQIPTISEQDMKTFEPFQASDGSFGAYFELDPHGAFLLQSLSEESRGKLVAVNVNGRHVLDLLIDRPISDGIAVIPYGLTIQDIALLRKQLKITSETKEKK